MSARNNGRSLTVAALAEAKRLSAEHLVSFGLRDTRRGVAIPYYAADGAEIAVKERTAFAAKDGSYWPKGVELAAYGSERIDRANKAGVLFVVEGESDCWALWHSRLPALGIPGANAAKVIRPEHVEAIGEIYISVEPDQGGERFRAGVVARLSALGFAGKVYELRMPDGIKDPADLHAADPETFKERFEECVKAATPVTLTPPKQPAAGAASDEKKGKPTQAEQLLELAGAADYFHTADGKAFALVKAGEGDGAHVETLSLRTKGFRNWLAREYYRATGKAASSKATQDALGVLDARACYDGPERPVYCRVGPAQDAIYLDLGDADWRTVRVDGDGWRVARSGAPLFRRPRGMLGLPTPAQSNDLNELRQYVNVSDEDWPLVVAWLLQATNPRGPYPILCLHGEQGTAKSTTARALRSLIDPNAAPLRSEPRDERDLVIAASNSWVIALDNLSHLEPWLSDALCRLSTGGGFGTRELYSDDEEIIFDAQRPVILTGIEDLATRGDLMDRSLLVRLPRIEEASRRTEAEFWSRFEAARPRMLGALLAALAGVLREMPRVRLRSLPRMADFAIVGAAAEKALGWPHGTFLAAYATNRADAASATLDASIIFAAFEGFVAGLPDGQWAGTWQALLDQLNAVAGDRARSRFWPATPRALSGQLRRLAPTLRAIGVAVRFDREGTADRRRLVLIERVEGEQGCETPSTPSRPADANGGRLDDVDGLDGQTRTRSLAPAGVEEGEL